VRAKLGDAGFTGKAPPEIVEKQRVREAELSDAIGALLAQRELLAAT
jgi:hypothetical protein